MLLPPGCGVCCGAHRLVFFHNIHSSGIPGLLMQHVLLESQTGYHCMHRVCSAASVQSPVRRAARELQETTSF